MKRNHTGHRIGECHHRAKLSDDDVRLIRVLRERHGLTYLAIAQKFECSVWCVRDIVKYYTRPL